MLICHSKSGRGQRLKVNIVSTCTFLTWSQHACAHTSTLSSMWRLWGGFPVLCQQLLCPGHFLLLELLVHLFQPVPLQPTRGGGGGDVTDYVARTTMTRSGCHCSTEYGAHMQSDRRTPPCSAQPPPVSAMRLLAVHNHHQ